jgi:hypothetical protein
VRIGVKPGQWGWSFDQLAASWEAAEESGFDLLACFDHVTASPGPAAAWDASSLLVAMAGRTHRVALAVRVINVCLRHPFLLAAHSRWLKRRATAGSTWDSVLARTGSPVTITTRSASPSLPSPTGWSASSLLVEPSERFGVETSSVMLPSVSWKRASALSTSSHPSWFSGDRAIGRWLLPPDAQTAGTRARQIPPSSPSGGLVWSECVRCKEGRTRSM